MRNLFEHECLRLWHLHMLSHKTLVVIMHHSTTFEACKNKKNAQNQTKHTETYFWLTFEWNKIRRSLKLLSTLNNFCGFQRTNMILWAMVAILCHVKNQQKQVLDRYKVHWDTWWCLNLKCNGSQYVSNYQSSKQNT